MEERQALKQNSPDFISGDNSGLTGDYQRFTEDLEIPLFHTRCAASFGFLQLHIRAQVFQSYVPLDVAGKKRYLGVSEDGDEGISD